MAGALQDHDRAIVIGRPTYGKGSTQSVISFVHEDAGVKLTTARWYTPAGRNIEFVPETATQLAARTLGDTAVRPVFRTDSGRKSVRRRRYRSRYCRGRFACGARAQRSLCGGRIAGAKTAYGIYLRSACHCRSRGKRSDVRCDARDARLALHAAGAIWRRGSTAGSSTTQPTAWTGCSEARPCSMRSARRPKGAASC